MTTSSDNKAPKAEQWNKGKLIGQKAPLKVSEVWAIRVQLQLGHASSFVAPVTTPTNCDNLSHFPNFLTQ
ncbi:MAG: hypothetical protein AAGC78_06785 [Cellvibrio sp.]|uniref:hypothetical protein n=1 Tax=Cellvibrio sp. TaxID=1965322 RepID=UPI0031B1A439